MKWVQFFSPEKAMETRRDLLDDHLASLSPAELDDLQRRAETVVANGGADMEGIPSLWRRDFGAISTFFILGEIHHFRGRTEA